MNKQSFFLVCSLVLLVSCGGPTNTYRVGSHGWAGDSIYFHLGLAADSTARPSLPKVTAVCKSCNMANPPLTLDFDPNGFARVYIPEAIHDLSTRLNLKGSGLDTTFIQKQRPPAEAAKFYQLDRPLIGRIFVTQTAPLYSDSTMGTVIGSAMVGDELNLFSEHPKFYLVHDPLYHDPVWMLKLNAVRMY